MKSEYSDQVTHASAVAEVHSQRHVMIAEFIFYILQGSVVIGSNLLFVVLIARSSILLRKYFLILIQFVVDSLMGLTSLLCGLGRIIVLLIGDTSYKSMRYCALMPWNLIATWVQPLSAIVLMIISIDRLLCLLFPIKYHLSSLRFQVGQIFVWSTILWPPVVISLAVSVSGERKVCSPFCWTSESMIPPFNRFFCAFRVTNALGSVFLYILVYVLTQQHRTRSLEHHRDRLAFAAFSRRQSRLTVTMGISCIFTLVLYVIPVTLLYFIDSLIGNDMRPLITVIGVIGSNFNCLINIAIIASRQTDIRDAFNRFIALKMVSLRSARKTQAMMLSGEGDKHFERKKMHI